MEPLNQYKVSGVSAKALGQAGFDRTEGGSRKGGFTVVATARQIAVLRAKGARITAPYGVTRTRLRARPATRRARAAGTSALQDPTHGYDVFRPWSLKPAPCPGTCARPNISLKT